MKLLDDYVVMRHMTGKKNRFFIWSWREATAVKKWLKHSEVQAWLNLLKEDE